MRCRRRSPGGSASACAPIRRSRWPCSLWPAPLPSGGAAYVTLASQRGVRRLIVLRGELAEADPFMRSHSRRCLFFIHRVVRPLEDAGGRRRVFLSRPGRPAPLRRQDEIGALARALQPLVQDLEARRQATAGLGADIAHEFKILSPSSPPPPSCSAASARWRARRGSWSRAASLLGRRLRCCIDDLLGLLRLDADVRYEPQLASIWRRLSRQGACRHRLRHPGIVFRIK